MNNANMQDDLTIVNNRVIKMLDSSRVNNDTFYRDVRTLTELIQLQLKLEWRAEYER